LLRADRAAAPRRVPRTRVVAAARELPPRRRAPGRSAPAAAGRAPRIRVPPPQLVHAGGLRAAAPPRRGPGDRPPPRAPVSDARGDGRLALHPLSLRRARPRRQLLRTRAGGLVPAPAPLARRWRSVRLLQQRLERLRAPQRRLGRPAPRAARWCSRATASAG